MDNTLGDRLEKIKKNERLSIEEYMELMGVTKSSYYNWKNEENYPNSEILIRILKKYPKYSADWLLMGVGSMLRAESLQNVADNKSEYGIEWLVKKVKELTQELDEVKERLEPKEEIIRTLGRKLLEKDGVVSPQKRYKKAK